MVVLRDKLLQLILNEKERQKDLVKARLSVGAGDYYRLLQQIVELQHSLEAQRKKKRIFRQ